MGGKLIIICGELNKFETKDDDFLIINKPEKGIHPAQQRETARIIAIAVNKGQKILLCTYSDYIIKELNTLIMLKNNVQIAKREGYSEDELLSIDGIKVYDYDQINGKLVPADISQEFGIEIKSFDAVIDNMNRIQEEIIWKN